MRYLLRYLVAFIAFALPYFATRDAHAYAWMIRHEYTSCATCHADPSGGSILTPYGRMQSELLLRSWYDGSKPSDRDPGTLGDFAFGVVKLPEPLLLQVDVRDAVLQEVPTTGTAPTARLINMQTDLAGQVTAGRFRVNGSIGALLGKSGGAPTWVLGRQDIHLVSRHHWLGVDLGEDKSWLLRAGRMNLPYGIRSIEHELWVRKEPGVDINSAQQHGAAISYSGEKLRGELMLIAGNFQISPDDYRQRGYSAFIEWSQANNATAGISSKLTRAEIDGRFGAATIRQSHGLFGRYALGKMAVFSGQVDMLLASPKSSSTQVGITSALQADIEPWQGLHLLGTGELLQRSFTRESLGFGLWGGAHWFFLPHMDLRADVIYRNEDAGAGRFGTFAFLGQVHAFL